MTNEAEDIIGIEFKVKLPDGMDFDNSNPVDCPPFELTLDPRFPYTGRTNKTYQHSINFSKREDGYWYIIISSTQLNPIKRLSGEILKGYFVTDANMEPGIYPIIVKETILGKSGTVKAETAEIASSYVVIGESHSPATATDIDLSGMTGYIPSFVVEQLNTDIASNTNLRSLNLSGTTYENLGATLQVPNNEDLLWYTSDKATLNRTFAADKWSTLCLPVTLQTSALKGTPTIKTMESYDDSDGTITLGDVTTMEKGKPYMVKCASATKLINEVAISDCESVSIGAGSVSSGSLTMKGSYQATTVSSTASKTYYGFSNDQFVGVNVGGTGKVKPFRAYLEYEGAAKTRSIGFVGEGDATGISVAKSENADAEGPVFNLQGMRMDNAIQTKGVYLRNGKKLIVK